jgi:hypothetical protein
VSKDLIELICNNQFCAERAAILRLKLVLESSTVHSKLRKALERIIPYEYFHVSVGRMAAPMLEKQGSEKQ